MWWWWWKWKKPIEMWWLSEKSSRRKDSMQRYVMSKHRNAGLVPFQTIPTSSKKLSAVSPRASFHLHDCRNDRVRKNGLGSIFITASFRGDLPSPEEDRLVLFTKAACV